MRAVSVQVGGPEADPATPEEPAEGRAAEEPGEPSATEPACACASGPPTQPIPILAPHQAFPPPRERPAGWRPPPPPAVGRRQPPLGPPSAPPWQLPDWSRIEVLPPPAQGQLRLDYLGVDDFDPDAELSSETLVRRHRPPPTRGWRLAIWAASGGRINPGLGAVESARLELVRRIRRPLPSTHRVAVVSVKGGVGKTTVAACLGSVLAEQRGDRIVAVDANPDAGTLSERLTGPGGMTVRDLYEDIPNLRSVVELTRYARLAGRLHVLGSEQEPALGEAFGAGEYLEVCELLARFYNVIVTDSGTGLVHAAMEATLATADSLVVVGAPTVDGASRASRTLAFLAENGYRELAEQATRRAVRRPPQPRRRPQSDPGALRGALSGRGGRPARPAPGHRRADRPFAVPGADAGRLPAAGGLCRRRIRGPTADPVRRLTCSPAGSSWKRPTSQRLSISVR